MSYKGSTWKSKPKEKNLRKLKIFLKKIEETKKELEAKYGSINIDLQTGEYTEIEKPAEK